MAIETLDDLANFFDDFAVTVTFMDPALGAIKGILDTERDQIDIGIDAVVPVLTTRTGLLTGVGEGSRLRLNGTQYSVKNRMDDGTGVTSLELFEYLGIVGNFFRPDGVSSFRRPNGIYFYLRA